jgi:aspartyl-tRNA(Asn)/glutamyl-tRNA(Gln) amidotransferase subunit B
VSADRYELVVGLEVHVQLKTRTKAFCSCSTAYGARANAHTCPVCLALPGALPAINARAVELGVRAALALGCTVHPVSVFARKHYFYPDLPKGYQISQYDRPLATGGVLETGPLRVRITRVHLEEDAGKSIHDRFAGATAIDLNRAGVPLIEIVSEPDIRSAVDAGRYLRELRQIMLYAGVSDVNMEEGSLRVDANVSARVRGAAELGTKTEVKNLNSFSNVERAVAAEFARQCALLEGGERVLQETMLWDATRGGVRSARSKEESHDYRYFPEPDLPPLVLAPEWIAAQAGQVPELPAARRSRFVSAFGVSDRDADVLVAMPALADYFEAVAGASGDGKATANWVTGEVLAERAADDDRVDAAVFPVPAGRLAELIQLVGSGTVSHTAAKTIYARLADTAGAESAESIAGALGLVQVSDEGPLGAWIEEVWAEHPEEARRFAAGETKLQGVLVGFVMKKSKGRADPRRVNQLLVARAGR